MEKKEKILIFEIKKIFQSQKPIWLMRQAGRYLPEYMHLKNKTESFLHLCFNSRSIFKITMQPIHRFDFDAAIFFSDILVIPYVCGLHLQYLEAKGPFFRTPLYKNSFMIEKLVNTSDEFFLLKIKRIIDGFLLCSEKMKNDFPQKSFIGFSGAPWTLLCYMVEGQSSQNYEKTKNFLFQNTQQTNKLIDFLKRKIFILLDSQIKAGADMVQIFDTFSSHLSFKEKMIFSYEPIIDIARLLKEKHPSVYISVFLKERTSDIYRLFLKNIYIDIVSISSFVSPETIRDQIQPFGCVQGNLDPQILVRGGEILKKHVYHIMNCLYNGPLIFNLGHGVLPMTPLDNVFYLMDLVRGYVGKRTV